MKEPLIHHINPEIDRMVYELNSKSDRYWSGKIFGYFEFIPAKFILQTHFVGMYGLTEEERKIVEGE